MNKTRRKFSPEDRLAVLQEVRQNGLTVTCRRLNISPSLVNRWQRKYEANGTEGLKPSYKRVDPLVRELEEENARLKRIIARQALEIEVKGELLKKTPIQTVKKRQ